MRLASIKTSVLALAVFSVPFLVSAALVDTDGNAVTNETALGDIDMAASTYGDLKNGVSPGYGTVSNAAVNAAITNALQDAAISTLSDSISTLNDTKASKADATLTDAAAWACNPASDSNGHAYHVEWQDRGWATAWFLFAGDGQTPVSTSFSTDASATRIEFSVSSGSVVATRAASQGYQLGTQEDKPLASEAEAEALRTAVASKQDNLPYPTNAIPYTAISGKPSLATVATSGSYNDLSDKPDIPVVPTNVSAFNNDAGYVTKSVTNGLLSTSTAANTYQPKGDYALASALAAASTASTNYTDTVAEELSRRLDDPKNYVISPLANYYYSGSSSIPAGNYFRAITGEGYSRYAAIIPVPHGKVVMSGDSDDPIISYFGNELEVDTDNLTIISVSSNDTEGKYNVSDVKFISDSSLGMMATFHCNILNPASELTEIGFSTSPGSMTFTIGDEQHTCTVATHSSTGFTYTDSIYNLSDGTWTSESYTISVAFNPSSITDWGWGIFGGVELAVKGDPGTVRVLGLRTGLSGEYGSGWGYKTYNFSSDRRNWEINVPNMQASCNKSSATTTKYFVTMGGGTNDFQCYVSPLSQSEHCIAIATLEETADAYGEDACAQGTWRVSMFPTITNRTDACALSVIATNRVQVGIIGVNETQDGVVPVSFTSTYNGQKYVSGYGYRDYAVTHTISNFRITAITGSGASRVISYSYDVGAVATYNGNTYYANYTGSQSVTLTSSLSIDGTVTKPSTLIVTDRNQHLFYDEGLMCTWELCVTNGVFYTRKVSNGDYRKEDE